MMLTRLKFDIPNLTRLSACCYSETPSSSTEQALCTGYSFVRKNGSKCAKFGVYFGEKDSRNCLATLGSKYTFVGAMIQSLIRAVRASHPGKDLHIKTDFHIVGDLKENLEKLNSQNYKLSTGDQVPNAKLLRELYLNIIRKNVTFEHVPTRTEENRHNYVTELIINDESFRSTHFSPLAPQLTGVIADSVYDSYGKLVTHEEKWPTCYIGAKYLKRINGYMAASFCTYWPVGQCKSIPQRLSLFPITLFRAYLCAIESALNDAYDNGLTEVLLIMKTPFYIQCLQTDWKNALSTDLPNKFLHERISDLVNKRKMHVRYQYIIPEAESSEWNIVDELCEEGMSFPVTAKHKEEYKFTLEDITNDVEIGDKQVLRARVFKQGTNLPPGIVYDKVNSDTPFSFIPWTKQNTPDLLLHIIKKAIEEKEKYLIIRTDSTKLIKSLKSWMPVWKRNGWRNSLHKPVKDEDKWCEIYKLSSKVKIRTELIEDLDNSDEQSVSKFRESLQVEKKKKNKKQRAATREEKTYVNEITASSSTADLKT